MEGAWVAVHRTDKGPTIKEQQAAIREGKGCSGSDCKEGSHLCGYHRSSHRIDVRIPCADMLGVICRDCRQLQWAFSAGNLQSIRTKAMRSYLVHRERKGPEEASSMADELADSPKTILPPADFADWPLDDVSSAILESDEDCLAFATAHPLLSAEALELHPTTIKTAPLAFELYRSVLAMTVSMDQVHPFDDSTPTSSGIRLQHSLDSVRLLPAVVQWRRSGHIGVATICLVAMSLQATSLPRKRFLLRRIQRLLNGLGRVEQACRSTETSMSQDLIPLSAAAHALVAPNASAAALAPLATAFAQGPAQPSADLDKLIETYVPVKSKLQELADGDAAAKKLLKVLRQDREHILAMDDAELKKQVKRFDELVGKIEDEFNKGKPTTEKRFCPRNPMTDMPTGFLPTTTTTTTRKMLLVAHVAIERAVTACDVANLRATAALPSSPAAGGSEGPSLPSIGSETVTLTLRWTFHSISQAQ